MVGRRGTEEARQAAREARRKREKRKKYEKLLEEHPAVRALRVREAPERPKAPLKRGVPKLVAQGMQDKDVAMSVTTMRRIMRYHHRAEDIVRRRIKGERVSLKDQVALIRQGENVEHDFREVVRWSCAAARRNPGLEAYASAIASHPEETEIHENLPTYLTRDQKAALRYMGVEWDELTRVWDSEVKPRLQKVRKVSPDELTKKLQRLEESADQLQYPQAPHRLVKQDILTLGGDDVDWEEIMRWVLIIFGIVLIIAAFCCFVGFFGPWCYVVLANGVRIIIPL